MTSSPVRSRALLLALLVTGSVPTSAAGASWSKPLAVPGSGDGVLNRVAIARDGTIAVGWGAATVAIRRPGGAWRVRSLAARNTSAQSTDIAFDPTGRLLVTWIHAPAPPGKALAGPFQVRAVTWTRRSGWGGVRVLGRSGHFGLAHPTITMNATGDALIAWRGFRRAGRRVVEAVSTSFRPAGGRFGREQRVRDGGPYRDVALDERGNAYAVWTTYRGPFLRFAFRARGRGWGAPRTIAGPRASLASLFVLPDRTAVVAYREADVDSEGNGLQAGAIRALIRSSAGNFGPVLRLSESRAHEIVGAVSPTGELTLAWATADTFDPPRSSDLGFVVRSAAGDLSAAQTVLGVHAGQLPWPIAYLDDGSALLAYGGENMIRAATRAPGTSAFGSPETIAARGLYPSLAVSGTTAVVAFYDLDARRVKVAARRP
jgi:hypothetical protein